MRLDPDPTPEWLIQGDEVTLYSFRDTPKVIRTSEWPIIAMVCSSSTTGDVATIARLNSDGCRVVIYNVVMDRSNDEPRTDDYHFTTLDRIPEALQALKLDPWLIASRLLRMFPPVRVDPPLPPPQSCWDRLK